MGDVMSDRVGQVWFDSEGSTYPELFLVVGPVYPTDFDSDERDEPGSVYHRVVMLYSGKMNGWLETPSRPWESQPPMKRIL